MTNPEVGEAFVEIVPSFKRFSTELRRGADSAAAGFAPLSGKINNVDAAVGKLTTSFKKLGVGATAVFSTITPVASTAAASIAGIGTALTVVGLQGASNLQALNARFNALKGQLQLGNESVSSFVQSLRDLELQTGLSTNVLADLVTRFTGLGISARSATGIGLVFGDALSTLGVSGGQLSATLASISTQLSQAASVGKFAGDELRSVLENLGGTVTRGQLIARIAKDTGDSASDVAKTLNDGALDFGVGFKALIEELSDPNRGLAGGLERQASTLPGVIARIKATVRQGLEDAFLPQLNTIADQLEGFLTDIRPQLAEFSTGFSDAFVGALPEIRELATTILPQIPIVFSAMVQAAAALAPIISGTVEGLGQVFGFIQENKDQVAGVFRDIGGAVQAIGQFALDLVGGELGLTLLAAAAREAGDVIGALGDTLTALGPITKTLGFVVAGVVGVIAAGFDGIAQGIGIVNRAITASIQGVLDAIGSLLNALAGVASAVGALPGIPDYSGPLREAAQWAHTFGDESVNAANRTTAALNTIPRQISTTLTINVVANGPQAGRPVGADGRPFQGPGYTDADKKYTQDAINKAANKIDFSGLNSGVGAGPSAGAKKAADEAKRAAEAIKKAMQEAQRDVNQIAKGTADQTVDEIRRGFNELVKDLKAAGLKSYVDQVRNIQQRLVNLAKRRDGLSAVFEGQVYSLDQLRDKLQQLKDTQTDFAASTRQSAIDLGNVAQQSKGIGTTFIGIRQQLLSALNTTRQFSAAIETLTAAGLNQTSLRQLIEAGPEQGLAAAQALLSGGAAGIAQINQLQATLDQQATAMGTAVSKTFYDAGIQAAAGLVAGLQSQEAAIEAQMNKIADKLAATIKKALKIKSPSRLLFDEVGVPSGQGIINGLVSTLSSFNQVGAATRSFANTVTFGPGSVVAHGATESGAQRMGTGLGYGIADVLERQLAQAVLNGTG